MVVTRQRGRGQGHNGVGNSLSCVVHAKNQAVGLPQSNDPPRNPTSSLYSNHGGMRCSWKGKGGHLLSPRDQQPTIL